MKAERAREILLSPISLTSSIMVMHRILIPAICVQFTGGHPIYTEFVWRLEKFHKLFRQDRNLYSVPISMRLSSNG